MFFTYTVILVVELNAPNFNLDLIHSFTWKMGNFSCLHARASHAGSYLTNHSLNPGSCSRLADLTM